MKLNSQDVKRSLRFKAIIYGFIAGYALQLVIGGLGGVVVAMYGVANYAAAEATAKANHTAFNQEAFLNSALWPTLFVMPIFTIALCISSGVLGGYIAGRKAKSAERKNAGLVGILFALTVLASEFIFPSKEMGDMPKEMTLRMNRIHDVLFIVDILIITPITIWGGSVAARKNALDTSQ